MPQLGKGAARHLALVVLVTSLTAAGGAAAAGTGPLVLDGPALTATLLSLDDLPSGWTRDDEALPPTPDETSGFCNGPNEAARAQAAGATASASVTLDEATDGRSVNEAAYAFPTRTAASSFVKETRRAAAACRSWQVSGPDGTETVSARQVTFPKVGDQSLALRNSAVTTTGERSSADQVTVRVGNHVVTIFTSGAGSRNRLTRTAVEQAVENLEQALEQA
jgi:hypothetical protein